VCSCLIDMITGLKPTEGTDVPLLCAVYKIMWKNKVQPDRPQIAI
jgi:hypothetical protein